jgi:hypothetical protein
MYTEIHLVSQSRSKKMTETTTTHNWRDEVISNLTEKQFIPHFGPDGQLSAIEVLWENTDSGPGITVIHPDVPYFERSSMF